MNIFITGGTGFLGNVLINDLTLANNHVYILARNKDKANKTLEKIDEKNHHQINFIYGDITLPNLGIKDEVLVDLNEKIDTVYHMAALVKFDEELKEELEEINYYGTKNTLKFADKINAKSFFYVSTAYTVGKGEEGKEELYPLNQSFNNPYEETKCKSEHLVCQYNDKMKTLIFRPSIIVGNSKTGEANSAFTIYGFIKGLEIFKKRVSKYNNFDKTIYHVLTSSNSTSNLVPVDYVSKVLVTALKHGKNNYIYNITNPLAPKNEDILSLIKELLGFSNLSITKTFKKIKTKEEELLNHLIANFNNYLNLNIHFQDDNTTAMLTEAGLDQLFMDKKMLKRIIFGYSSTNAS